MIAAGHYHGLQTTSFRSKQRLHDASLDPLLVPRAVHQRRIQLPYAVVLDSAQLPLVMLSKCLWRRLCHGLFARESDRSCR